MAMTNAERQARYREAGREARAEVDEAQTESVRWIWIISRLLITLVEDGTSVAQIRDVTGLTEEVIGELLEIEDTGRGKGLSLVPVTNEG